MENLIPLILVNCKKQVQLKIKEYLTGFNGAEIHYINSASDIKGLTNVKTPALLIVEISPTSKNPPEIISTIIKKTNDKNIPIFYISQTSLENLELKPFNKPGYFDILQYPFASDVFVNKIELFIRLKRLMNNSNPKGKNAPDGTTNEKTSSYNRFLKQIEELTREIDGQKQTTQKIRENIQVLEENARFHETIIESIPVPFFVKNKFGKYIKCNKAFEQFIEKPRKEFLGRTIFDIELPEIADNIHQSDMNIMQSGKNNISEEIRRKSDGSIINTIIHKNVLHNKQKEAIGIIGTVVDISEIKRAEKLLKIQHTIDYLSSLKKGLLFTLKNILDQIMELEWVDVGGIYLYNNDKEELKLVYSSGATAQFLKSAELFGKGSPQLNIVLKKKAIYGIYSEVDEKTKSQLYKENLKLVAVIPMTNPETDELLGCLNLASRKYDKISEQEKSDIEFIVQSFASLIMYVQAQVEIKELNTKLEKKVRERTQKYEDINKQLSEEIQFHKETKIALSFSENLYRNIFNNANEGIVLFDSETFKLIDINEKAHADLGYTRAEFMNLSLADYTIYKSPDQRNELIKTLFQNKQVEYIIKHKSKDGKILHRIVYASLFEINGKKYILGIVNDVTKLKKTEKKLKKAHDKIVKINENLEKRIDNALMEQRNRNQFLIQKSKLESLGELAAGIAHEINQPLGVMALSLENLQMKIASKKATSAYFLSKFNSIDENINRIRTIIDHIRIFSRDQDSIAIEKIYLIKVVKKALSLIGAQYRNHNIHIRLDLKDNIGFSVGSNIQVEQLVLNLLSNAKYAVEDKASFKNETDYKKEIAIRTGYNDKTIILTIEDNGAGIDEAHLPNIFDPFFTTKPEGFGTGLGLSIAYGIVKNMRGEIQVESKINEFTKFSVFLPRFPEKD